MCVCVCVLDVRGAGGAAVVLALDFSGGSSLRRQQGSGAGVDRGTAAHRVSTEFYSHYFFFFYYKILQDLVVFFYRLHICPCAAVTQQLSPRVGFIKFNLIQ